MNLIQVRGRWQSDTWATSTIVPGFMIGATHIYFNYFRIDGMSISKKIKHPYPYLPVPGEYANRVCNMLNLLVSDAD